MDTMAGHCLRVAASLVEVCRAAEHGDKTLNLGNVATLWSTYLYIKGTSTINTLDAHDVATMLELMKIARRCTGKFNPDDYIDSAGYAACAYEVRAKELGGWKSK